MNSNFNIDLFIKNFEQKCNKVTKKTFNKNELITSYIKNRNQFCILIQGNADLVRYDLRLDDLKLLKDTLYYPPTTAMRNIHMYPPYEKVKTH